MGWPAYVHLLVASLIAGFVSVFAPKFSATGVQLMSVLAWLAWLGWVCLHKRRGGTAGAGVSYCLLGVFCAIIAAVAAIQHDQARKDNVYVSSRRSVFVRLFPFQSWSLPARRVFFSVSPLLLLGFLFAPSSITNGLFLLPFLAINVSVLVALLAAVRFICQHLSLQQFTDCGEAHS